MNTDSDASGMGEEQECVEYSIGDNDELIKETCNASKIPNATVITLVEPNLWCLALVLFPAACIFGNVLVALAVLSERSLKTSTNFLLVSLACADLLVGTLVMPFSVYLTINRLQWYLPEPVCNFFCVVDVSASTSSIVHLVAISIDRFYAVVRHMEYKSPTHKRRVYGTIIFSWLFSIGIGLPLGIGMNQGGGSKEEHECGIVNPDFMLYSSIFAFYIPCLVMTIMYSVVFYKLHRRMRAVKLQEMAAGQMVQFGDNLGNILQHAYGNEDNLRQASIIWAIPFLKTLEATIAENDDMSTEELDELTNILHTLESDPQNRVVLQTMEGIPESPETSLPNASPLPTSADSNVGHLLSSKRPRSGRRSSRLSTIIYAMTGTRLRRRRKRLRRGNIKSASMSSAPSGSSLSSILASMTKAAGNPTKNADGDTSNELSESARSDSERRRRQSLSQAKQKIKALKNRAIELLMKLKSKQGMAIRKETRATKLVSTVMLVFLLCWTPFFTLNVVKVSKLRTDTWTYELESLFIFFTWLGYLNSCLNPIIYSLFNRKFRATFQKLLHCPKDEMGSPLQRQRRLYTRPFAGDTPFVADDMAERKTSWFTLARRSNSSPRKTGFTQQFRFRSVPATLRNGAVIAKTRSLPPADAADAATTSQMPETPLVAYVGEPPKQRKITWSMDVQNISLAPNVSLQSKAPNQIIFENTVLCSPPIERKMNAEGEKMTQKAMEHRNGTDAARLRRVQSLRCSESHDQNVDLTEPVEV